MEEQIFFDMIDKAESLSDQNLTEGYFPTITELEEHLNKGNQEDMLPIVSYFANDPFTKQKIDGYTTNEYKATVKFCKDYLSKVELT